MKKNDEEENISDTEVNSVVLDESSDLLEVYFTQKGFSLDETSITGTTARSHLNDTVMNQNIHMDRNELLLNLDTFEKLGRTHSKITNIQWWETIKTEFPIIYELSLIINGIAPSQASVERAFSVFALVFSDKRYSLAQSLLEAILLMTLNREIVLDIFASEIEDLTKSFEN